MIILMVDMLSLIEMMKICELVLLEVFHLGCRGAGDDHLFWGKNLAGCGDGEVELADDHMLIE